MTSPADIELICRGRHPDPFAVLGPHADAASGITSVQVFAPGAEAVELLETDSDTRLANLASRHVAGFFEGPLPAGATGYRLRLRWCGGTETVTHDPYRFGPALRPTDVWLLAEGSHLRPFEVLGAHPGTMDGVAGTCFALWAPNASRASVVGDFNLWDGRRHPMRLRRECGVWELFIPGVGLGERYKFELLDRHGRLLPQKADPYARRGELRPATASVVAELPAALPASAARQRANALDAPMSIYEVHLGSWRRKADDRDRWLTWDELADELIGYAADMGFTHIELMPVSEHPFDGSWGYQTLGMYAPTARFGEPAGFARFVARAHAANLGVLIDWVPAHFPSDAHGLAQFDGSALYEYADPREGFHPDWNTAIYNFGRSEVKNFLAGSALYWLERYGVDGLRVDAVASMLYRDYSRKHGEWIPNAHGGRENLEAIAFLQRTNEVIGVERPQAVSVAEESTAFPAVSRPVYAGGLGFHYKWNMGWMHDTLQYMARDPIHRKHHHGEMSFSLVYAYNENFVLPISHDEVVHGKGSLLGKMPGDRWQQFANLRAYLGYMWAHPGKKLLFMGCEFAQLAEWNHDRSLDWHLLDGDATHNPHAGVQRLVRDLNSLYRSTPALHQRDFTPDGFQWIGLDDAERSVLSFVRRGEPRDDGQDFVVVVCNFTPTVHHGYRVGVPRAGVYRERINTDSTHYGGSDAGNAFGEVRSQPLPWQGQAHSVELTLPPLSTVIFDWRA